MSDMEKIKALSDKIDKMQKQTVKSTRITAILYLLVVLFVFVYTTFIMNWVKEEVSVDNVVDLTRVYIEEQFLTDERCQAWMEDCKAYGPAFADYLVNTTHEMIIPKIKKKIMEVVDKKSDDAMVIMQRDLFPKIKQLLLSSAKELSTRKGEKLTKEEFGKELASVVAVQSEKELNKLMNDNIKNSIDEFRGKLDELSSVPLKKLSETQKAKRKIIVSWIYLMEHDASPVNSFGELLGGINGAFKDLIGNTSISE